MTTDEPIRTDASTVHRSGERQPEPVAAGSVDAEQIAEAKTVIRGSSRALSDRHREALDRTPTAVAKVLLGQRLNHFLLEELIGGGGMGAVFRAHDEQLDRTVAIKVIPFVGDDPDLQRRFRNEAQSAAKLDHPRIARVFDAGIYDEWHYIVFEYIEGTNVRDLVNTAGVLSVDDAVFYTSQLADALQHAADRGIVHRDIKPSNVLIGDAGKIKLVDMGLARSDNLDLSDDMTASGVTLGTFDYISPEQAHDPRDADFRSDIYSLGCTLYFMLTGSPPYPGGTMLQKLLSHGNAPPPDARELRPEVSQNLSQVIDKMLAKKPGDRYQSAQDLIADLSEVANRDGLVRAQAIGPVTFSQPNPMIAFLETHAPWIAAAMLLIISAGWLHLESAAMRVDIAVSPDAEIPLTGPIKPADPEVDSDGDSIAPSTEAAAAASADSVSSGDADPSASEPEPEPYDSPETPPTFKNLTLPTELTDEPDPTTAIEMAIEAASGDDPFLRSPFEEDVSIEPLADPFPHVIRLIGSRVEPGNDRDSDGAALASSLSQALDLAARYGASRVEIAVPTVYSEPVSVQADNLLVTSTVGGSTIIFQSPDAIAMERSRMFSIGSYEVELDDMHFVWNVPSSDVDGGTLFDINSEGRIKLTDCSVTISNPTSRDNVYAFAVITDPEQLQRSARGLTDPQSVEFPLVSVELYNVVVRGSMTMLHMDYAAKLWLSWDNGLLAITDRMIETAGARLRPPDTFGPIRLTLTRVTAHAPRGLVKMQVGVDGAYPVPIDRSARRCVFIVDEATPHFEVAGLAALDEQSPLLELNGAFNAYVADPATDVLLRMAASDGQQESLTRIGELATWPDENSPKWDVSWTKVRLSDAPASQRSPVDYAQEGASPPGFDPKYLPDEDLMGDSVISDPAFNPL